MQAESPLGPPQAKDFNIISKLFIEIATNSFIEKIGTYPSKESHCPPGRVLGF
jgi:hypothetical protein